MLAAKALTPAQMEKVLAAAWRLEKLADIGELLGLLCFRERKTRSSYRQGAKTAKKTRNNQPQIHTDKHR